MSASVGASFVPARPIEVSAAEIDGDTVLYHLGTGHVARLDPVGSVIWQCVDGVTSIDELSADLAAGFAVQRSIVCADLIHLTEKLMRADLLVDARKSVASPAARKANHQEAASTPDERPRLLTDPPSP